jgi:hypothetical protein
MLGEGSARAEREAAFVRGGGESTLPGPIADALTHTGQLTLLRRLVDAPIKGESYQRALIDVCQTSLEQPLPRREFD